MNSESNTAEGGVRDGLASACNPHSPFAIWTIMLHLAWVRTSIDLIKSRVLPVAKVQVVIEGVST